jgi:hypothetical protein
MTSLLLVEAVQDLHDDVFVNSLCAFFTWRRSSWDDLSYS